MSFFAACGKCGRFFRNAGEYSQHTLNCDGVRRPVEPKVPAKEEKPATGGSNRKPAADKTVKHEDGKPPVEPKTPAKEEKPATGVKPDEF